MSPILEQETALSSDVPAGLQKPTLPKLTKVMRDSIMRLFIELASSKPKEERGEPIGKEKSRSIMLLPTELIRMAQRIRKRGGRGRYGETHDDLCLP